MSVYDELQKRIAQRQRLGNLRRLRTTEGLIDFASNDYLGLAKSMALKLDPSPLSGSTGSRLLTGNSSYAEALEQKIASLHNQEAGLLFNCGYMANVGLLSSVATAEDSIFYDLHIHASMHDGMRLSKASTYPFRHNDLSHLEKRLKMSLGRGKRFVCIESVYSIDGSIAPLEEISALCTQYGAHLIVDEAHAIGVLGPQGYGLVAEKALEDSLFAQVITFGKALGAHGAIVLGKRLLKEYLLNFSRPAIYTTALPLQTLVSIQCAYKLLPTLHDERAQLQKLIRYFSFTSTSIQPFRVKDNQHAHTLSQKLARHGFDVRPILSPTVPRGEECLRVCLHAYNSEQEVKQLLEILYD